MRTYEQFIKEGVYDPNIFKAVFMAGGPGSGKSFIAGKTTGGLGLKMIHSDTPFERFLKKEGLSLKMPEAETEKRDVERARAKKVTASKKFLAIKGRLGIIIDGTGHVYDKIAKQATELKQLGYDVHMIFVNTSLDTALERNANRARSVPEPLVVKSWKSVQSNIGKFSQYFRQNFVVVDNNDAGEDVFNKVFKQVMSLAKSRVQNNLGKQWISNELAKKRR